MSSLELMLLPLMFPAAIPFVIAAGAVYAGSMMYSANLEKRKNEIESAALQLGAAFDTIIDNLEKECGKISVEYRPEIYQIKVKKRKSDC